MSAFGLTNYLPITDPTWIFFWALCIILFAPILSGHFRIPHIIGMILAGVIVENGECLLNDDVFNGTVVTILFTCIISSIATECAARKPATMEHREGITEKKDRQNERIMIPVANPENIEGLVDMALMIKSPKQREEIFALSVVDDNGNPELKEIESSTIWSACPFRSRIPIQKQKLPTQITRCFSNNSLLIIYPDEYDDGMQELVFVENRHHNNTQMYDAVENWFYKWFKKN